MIPLKNAIGRLLLIRADGGPTIGFGHVMRSMAIAEEWLLRGGQCMWATTNPRALEAAGTGRDDMRILPMDVAPGGMEDSRLLRMLAEEYHADWVMSDLFAFTPAWFLSAGSRGARWMIVHDEALQLNERIRAVLNPGPQATEDFYRSRDSGCRLLLGLDYALIRSEIRARSERRSARGNPPRHILVTFGGSDPLDLTWGALDALSRETLRADVRLRVIMGPGYRGACAERGANFQNLSIEFVRYTSNMGGHYAWADLIICGASTTLWEAFYFGLPAVVIPAAENQYPVFDVLASSAATMRFARPDAAFASWLRAATDGAEAEQDWLARATAAAAMQVDGKGVERVVDYLVSQR